MGAISRAGPQQEQRARLLHTGAACRLGLLSGCRVSCRDVAPLHGDHTRQYAESSGEWAAFKRLLRYCTVSFCRL